MKKYNKRKNKNIIYVIYSFIIIQNHTKSSMFIMIIKLDQYSIILKKLWMKKHDVNYHDHDNSIFFHFNHCNYLEAFNRSYSNKSSQTKKKKIFSKRNFSDQSKTRIESVENKEIKIFFEKINNSSKTILKKTTLIEFNKRLSEHRMNESWKKKLRKIEISLSRILKKELKMNSFYDEISSKFHEKLIDEKSIIEIHSITIVSFNILSC